MFYNGKDSMKEKLALQHKYKKAFRMPKREIAIPLCRIGNSLENTGQRCVSGEEYQIFQ